MWFVYLNKGKFICLYTDLVLQQFGVESPQLSLTWMGQGG